MHDAHTAGKYAWMIFFAILPPVVAGFHGDIIHTSYLLSTLPTLIIIAGLGLRVMTVMNRYIGWVCVGIVMWIMAEQALTVVSSTPSVSYYRWMQEISSAIHKDYQRQAPEGGSEPKIALAVIAGEYLPYDGWGTGALWYFLEEQFGRKLVSLQDWGVNFSPVVGKATYFYVLCDYRGMARDPADLCTEKFRSVRDYLMEEKQEIYTSDEFSLWRFRIDPSKLAGGDNMVYPDPRILLDK